MNFLRTIFSDELTAEGRKEYDRIRKIDDPAERARQAKEAFEQGMGDRFHVLWGDSEKERLRHITHPEGDEK